MSSYCGSFNELDANTNKQSVAFFTVCDPKLYGLFEETIGFQEDMTRKLRPVKDDHDFDNLKMCYDRCAFNTSHLYSAYRILRSDDSPTFFAVIRIVFESLPKLFYCMRHPEKAKHVFCCEEFLYREMVGRRDEVTERFCKSVKEPINRKKCWNVTKPKQFREKVYTKDRQKEIDKKYGQYSTNVHPSFDPVYARTRDELEYVWKTGLGILTCLSLMNAFAMVNAAERDLTAYGEYENSKRFVERAMREAGEDLRRGMAQLYPDKGEYTEMLSFALPNGPTD